MTRSCFPIVLASVLGVCPAFAQEPEGLRREVQESQLRLERIREERAQLQREMAELRSRVLNVSGELENIERQLSVSHSVLGEIDFQVDAVTRLIRETSDELHAAREELRARQEILNRRLRDIYKRGPLYTVRVLLGSDSFADLLSRIHYLQVIATYDRALVTNVGALERELSQKRRELQETLLELTRLRGSQLGELSELRRIEDAHLRTLQDFRNQERQVLGTMQSLAEDERLLEELVASLERGRLDRQDRTSVAGQPVLSAPNPSGTDVGRLPWPVEGMLAYPFGIERRSDGTTVRWNGIGIRAAPGTPVHAVRAGTVARAGPFEGYGPSVILSHGEGVYTLYLYLDELGVLDGQSVEVGQVVGTVGGQGAPEGPRIEFQIRAPVDGGLPQALDPLLWLRPAPGQP